jgi:poly-gamma-glutamate capsule biosynthesis protein CapA/YwtB (metallophosphatase superfamily)
VPDWVVDTVGALDADAILVTPHWGWNMAAEPMAHVRAVAHTLLGAGATLVAGHSAHVFHGITPHVLYDLGDFLDDYRVDRELRNAGVQHDRCTRVQLLPIEGARRGSAKAGQLRRGWSRTRSRTRAVDRIARILAA